MNISMALEQPLIHFLDKIYNTLNKPVSEYTLGIFLDLTCDVEILLSQLEHYGFRGTNLWFKNRFFFNFSNFVNMNLIKVRNNSLRSSLRNRNFPVYVT